MRQKITVQNETNYSSRDLRRLFVRCLKERGVYGQWRTYIFKISYSRTGGTGGRGRYNRPWVQLRLPNVSANDSYAIRLREDGSERITQVIMHEIDHNLGLHHKDMIISARISVPWFSQYKIGWSEPKKKSRANLQEKRYANAMKKLDEWTARKKRAASAEKKWRAKVRYYVKALTKKAAARGEG